MQIKGTVSRILVEKPTGFKILSVSVSDLRMIPADKRNPSFPNSVTVVGLFKGVEEAYVIEFEGEWESRESDRYWNWQFKSAECFVCEFETPELMLGILSELPGVGRELAGRILKFYDNPQDIIENHPQMLTQLKGVSVDMAGRIRTAFLEYKEQKGLESFLAKYGVKQKAAKEIASFYGASAYESVKNNPYKLCDDRFLTFRCCDKIGKDLGFRVDSESRIKSAMNQVLNVQAASKGHTYLTGALLLDFTNDFLKKNAAIEGVFTREQLEKKLHVLTEKHLMIYENGRYYHPDRYANEKDVAEILLHRKSLKSAYSDVPEEEISQCMGEVERSIGITLDEIQRQAVLSAIQNITSVITGGPGSGKTTLLSVFIRTIELLSKRMGRAKPVISLAAPTGMAAKRMANSSGREAKTIHKLFDIRYDVNENRNDPHPVMSDVIILDEASMLDIDVMACIMRSVRDDCILIFVGDIDQSVTCS